MTQRKLPELVGASYVIYDRRRDADANTQAALDCARDIRQQRERGYVIDGHGYDSEPHRLVWSVMWRRDDEHG